MLKPMTGLLVSLLLFSGGAFAQGDSRGATAKGRAQPEMSKEARERMAKMHEQMASCLRSGKDLTACHDEVAVQYKEFSSNGMCPMMGHQGMYHQDMKGMRSVDGHGHMHGSESQNQ